eukprot:m.201148 g.201148  ORF g.201148 m.201148 type:complete len:132 (-) comp16862_c1_seq3:661-1056(-)
MVVSLVVLASVTAANPPSTTAVQNGTINGTDISAPEARDWLDLSFVNETGALLRFPRRTHSSRRPANDGKDGLTFTSDAVKWTSLVSMIFFVVAYAFRSAGTFPNPLHPLILLFITPGSPFSNGPRNTLLT